MVWLFYKCWTFYTAAFAANNLFTLAAIKYRQAETTAVTGFKRWALS